MVLRGASLELANSTPVAVKLFAFEVSKTMRVTVALGRIARLLRGGSGSMYPEREYERVQSDGLIDEDATYAPHEVPP